MKMKRSLLSALLAMGVLFGLAAGAKAQNAGELREEFHRTFPLAANGSVSLENISGVVKIAAWDRSEIKVDAVKRAYSRERLDEAQIKFVADADSINIHTEYPERNYRIVDGDNRRQSLASVDYVLTVPRGANLDAIELVNGTLEIEGLTGDVKASLVNGPVTARGLVGEARLSTVNGRLEATFDRLDAAKPISLGSVNGQLTLTIPSDANAHLRANTVSGSITNDFGLPVRRGEYVGRDLSGTLGSGGPRIKLSNVSGAITIRHAADNRPLSRATNQLTDARDGDYDDDHDNDDAEAEARDAQRERQRAAREANREAARAQREAQRAARAAQLEGQSDTRAAQAEAAEQAREARQEAERAVREAQLENAETQREIQREAQRAVRDSQREIQRASREAAREIARTREDGVFSDNNDLRLVERESKSFPTSGVPTVTLNTFDGRISIRAWDKPEVMVNAIKRASDEQSLRGIIVKTEQRGSEINVQTNYDNSAARRTGGGLSTNASVTFDVFVPRNANIKALSGDGRVELEGVTGGVQVQTGDGRIDVRDGGGQLIAKTGDGHIDVSNYTGDVDAKTGDGRINLDGRFAQLAARTGSGSISLALPSDLDATIETDAESVTNDGMTLDVEAGEGRKLRRYKIGRGGTVFNLRTGDGNVYLRRR